MDKHTPTTADAPFNPRDREAREKSHLDSSVAPDEAMPRERNPIKRFFELLGPGLITGAADDDPSGIGTYSQAGAAFGFATLWTGTVHIAANGRRSIPLR